MVDRNTENPGNGGSPESTPINHGKQDIFGIIGKEYTIFTRDSEFQKNEQFQSANDIFAAFIDWLIKKGKNDILQQLKSILGREIVRNDIKDFEISYGTTIEYVLNTQIERKLTKPFKKAVCNTFLNKFENILKTEFTIFPIEIYYKWTEYKNLFGDKFDRLNSILEIGNIIDMFFNYLKDNGIAFTTEQVKAISSIKIPNNDILNQLHIDGIIEQDSFDAISTITDISQKENLSSSLKQIINNFETLLLSQSVSYLGEDLNNIEQMAQDLTNSFQIPKLNSIFKKEKYKFDNKSLNEIFEGNKNEITRLNPENNTEKNKILAFFFGIKEKDENFGKALISLYKNNFNIQLLNKTEQNSILKEISQNYKKDYIENIAKLIGINTPGKIQGFENIIDNLFDLNKESIEIPYKQGNETKFLTLKIKKNLLAGNVDIDNLQNLYDYEGFNLIFEVDIPNELEEYFKFCLKQTATEYSNFAGKNLNPSYKIFLEDNENGQITSGYPQIYFEGTKKKIKIFKNRFADTNIESPLIEVYEEDFYLNTAGQKRYNLEIKNEDKKISLPNENISNILFLFGSIIGYDEPLETELNTALSDTFDNILPNEEQTNSSDQTTNNIGYEFDKIVKEEINQNIDILDPANQSFIENINGVKDSLSLINQNINEFTELKQIFEQLDSLDEINYEKLNQLLVNFDGNLNILDNSIENIINTSLNVENLKNTLAWIHTTKEFILESKDKIGNIATGILYYNNIWLNDESTNKEFLQFLKQNAFEININYEVEEQENPNIQLLVEDIKELAKQAEEVLGNGEEEAKESIDGFEEDESMQEISSRIHRAKLFLKEETLKDFENIFKDKEKQDKNTQIEKIGYIIDKLSCFDTQLDDLYRAIEELELSDDLVNLIAELEELSKDTNSLIKKAKKLLEELEDNDGNKNKKDDNKIENNEDNELKELLKEWNGIDGDSNLDFPNKDKNKNNTILFVYFQNSKLPGGGSHLAKIEILGSKNPYKFRITSAEYTNKGEFTKEIILNAENLRLIKSHFDKICKFKKINNLKDFFDYINNFNIKTDNNKALNEMKKWQKDKGIECDGGNLKKKDDNGKIQNIKYIGKTVNKYDGEEKKTVGCFYKVDFGTNGVKLTYEGGGYSQEMDYNSFMMFVSEKGLTPYTKNEYKNTVDNLELEKAETKGPKFWMSIGAIIKSIKKFPEQIKWKLEQRNNFKTAKLYSMFAKALPPIGILGQIRNEAITEYDSSIWSVIQKYKERASRADVGGGGIHAKQAAKSIEKDIFESKIFKGTEFQYKAVGYLLYAIEKGGGPYFRNLNKYAGKGLRLKAILGENHHKKYMLKMRELQKKVNENPNDEDALDQLIKSEIFYIKDNMPAEIFGTQAGSALEGGYINMLSDSKVSEAKKGEEIKGEFGDVYGGFGAYFEHLRAPNMLGALQAMVPKIDSEGLYKDFYRCMLIPVISGVSRFNWVRNNRDEFKAIGRTYALPITTFVDDYNGSEKIVKIIDYISKKNGLSGDDIFSKAIGWKKEDITISNYSKGHLKMFKKMEGWWSAHGDMVIRALNYGEDYLLKAQEDKECDHQTQETIKEYFDNKVNMSFTEEWTANTKGFISSEALPFYKNGIFNLGAGPIDNLMMRFDDGEFKHKFAEGMWSTLQNKIINMGSKSINKYELKFLLQKYNTWFKNKYFDEMKYMISALSKVKRDGESGYKYLTPFMKRQISRKKRDNDVPEIVDNTLGEFQKFFIKNIDMIDKDMIIDVFGEQLAENFEPSIVENFEPGGYSGSKLKGLKGNQKFINYFDGDFNI